MTNDEKLERYKQLYIALLCIPHGMWRNSNRDVYANVRDYLAILLDMSPEATQNYFETIASEKYR